MLKNKYLIVLFITIFSCFVHESEATSLKDNEAQIRERNIRIFQGDMKLINERIAQMDFIHNQDLPQENKSLFYAQIKDNTNAKSKFFIRLFNRMGNIGEQDVPTSQKVFGILNERRLSRIHFDSINLVPYDYGGVCSAMALDFAARCLNDSIVSGDVKTRREMVESYDRFYSFANSTFKSVQQAYNTINVEFPNNLDELEESTEQKIQSLANYHGMKLIPVTRSIKNREIFQKSFPLDKVVNALPDGVYVIRLLDPEKNHKLESYGHTMSFVKSADFSVFFDNSVGATEVRADMGKYVSREIENWFIPVVKLYYVSPDESCIEGLSEEEVSENDVNTYYW